MTELERRMQPYVDSGLYDETELGLIRTRQSNIIKKNNLYGGDFTIDPNTGEKWTEEAARKNRELNTQVVTLQRRLSEQKPKEKTFIDKVKNVGNIAKEKFSEIPEVQAASDVVDKVGEVATRIGEGFVKGVADAPKVPGDNPVANIINTISPVMGGIGGAFVETADVVKEEIIIGTNTSVVGDDIDVINEKLNININENPKYSIFKSTPVDQITQAKDGTPTGETYELEDKSNIYFVEHIGNTNDEDYFSEPKIVKVNIDGTSQLLTHGELQEISPGFADLYNKQLKDNYYNDLTKQEKYFEDFGDKGQGRGEDKYDEDVVVDRLNEDLKKYGITAKETPLALAYDSITLVDANGNEQVISLGLYRSGGGSKSVAGIRKNSSQHIYKEIRNFVNEYGVNFENSDNKFYFEADAIENSKKIANETLIDRNFSSEFTTYNSFVKAKEKVDNIANLYKTYSLIEGEEDKKAFLLDNGFTEDYDLEKSFMQTQQLYGEHSGLTKEEAFIYRTVMTGNSSSSEFLTLSEEEQAMFDEHFPKWSNTEASDLNRQTTYELLDSAMENIKDGTVDFNNLIGLDIYETNETINIKNEKVISWIHDYLLNPNNRDVLEQLAAGKGFQNLVPMKEALIQQAENAVLNSELARLDVTKKEFDLKQNEIENSQINLDNDIDAFVTNQKPLLDKIIPLQTELNSIEDRAKTLQLSLEGLVSDLNSFDPNNMDVNDQDTYNDLYSKYTDQMNELKKLDVEHDLKREQYNALVTSDEMKNLIATEKKLTDRQLALNTNIEALNVDGKKIKQQYETLFSELGFNASKGIFDPNFKATQAMMDVQENQGGAVMQALGVFTEEVYDLALGVPAFLIKGGADIYGDFGGDIDQANYLKQYVDDFMDAQMAGYSKPREKGIFEDQSFAGVTRSVAEMLPFTLAIVGAAQRGDVKFMTNARKAFNYKNMSMESMRTLHRQKTMINTATAITMYDNHRFAEEQGLSGFNAYSLAFGMSMAEGVAQLVMTDRNFFMSSVGKNFIKNLTGSLTKSTSVKSARQIVINSVNNTFKEIGEEELTFAMQEAFKYSHGLGHTVAFNDINAHADLVVGTLYLSGTIQQVSNVKTYNAIKAKIHDEFAYRGEQTIENFNTSINYLKNKLDRYKGLTNQPLDKIEALENQLKQYEDGLVQAQASLHAKKTAPSYASFDHLNLLEEKYMLEISKEGVTDKGELAAINQQIKDLDKRLKATDAYDKYQADEKKETEKIKKQADIKYEADQKEVEDIDKKVSDLEKKIEDGLKGEKLPDDFDVEETLNEIDRLKERKNKILGDIEVYTTDSNEESSEIIEKDIREKIVDVDEKIEEASKPENRNKEGGETELQKLKGKKTNLERQIRDIKDTDTRNRENNRLNEINYRMSTLDPVENASEIKRLNDERIKLENELNKDGAYGGFSGNAFVFTDVNGTRKIVINRKKALQRGFITSAQHEFLHVVLNDALGETSQNLLGAAVYKFLGDNQQIIKSYKGEFNQRLAAYDGSTVFREVMPLLSEAMTKKDLVISQGFLQNMKDVFRQTLQQYGARDITFDTGQDVLNFIKDYNKTIKSGKKNKAITKLMQQGATGDLVIGAINRSEGRQFSKTMKDTFQKYPDMKKDFDDLTQNPDGTKRWSSKEEFRNSPEFWDGYMQIENSKGLEALIKFGVRSATGINTSEGINQFVEETKQELLKRYERNFDASAANGSLFGWLTGGSGVYTNSTLYRAKGDVMVKYGKKPVTAGIPIGDIDIADTDDTTGKVDTDKKKRKILLSDRLNVTSKVNKKIKALLPDIKKDVSNLTFKKLINQVPEIVSELFGINAAKLTRGNKKFQANITKEELRSAQMFINRNADILLAMLPDGATVSGTSTGVPKTILDAFYTKTDSAKFKKTGSRAGLPIQVKNKNIGRKQFLETFGIIDGVPTRTDRNTSARVLSLADLTGKMMTNQAVRKNLDGITDYNQFIENIKDGTPDIMFSRAAKKFAKKYKLEYLNINDRKNGINNFDLLIDKFELLAGYLPPGFVRRVDLYNFGVYNPVVKTYARELTLETDYASIFTIGRREDRVYLRPDAALGKSMGEITKEKVDRYNKSGVANFNIMVKGIKDAIDANKDDKLLPVAAYYYLQSAANDTSHPLRGGAKYLGGDITNTGAITFEHALQSANVRDLLMDAIMDPKENFDQKLKDIKKNYYLVAMARADAKKLDRTTYIDRNGKRATYKNGMGRDWSVELSRWFERYFNSDVNFLDPANFMLIENNKSFAEEYKITQSGYTFSKPGASKMETLNNAIMFSRSASNSTRGITVLDFDDTLAITKSNVIVVAPDGTTTKINAEEFAKKGAELLDEGFKFDFSEFSKVIGAKKAPLFEKALKLQKKFGPESMFVLTARPADSAEPIFQFLKANGLNIPLKNITGLANSTAEAKALWIADKVSEGYNDFYFADDALQNVQAVKNMLDQFDVKSKVQQARIQFSRGMNANFNKILEDVTGIDANKRFSDIKARKRGAEKGKFRFFVPPSHEDFVGLLYNFLGKGLQGNLHRDFFERSLLRPLNRGYRELDTARQSIANDYKNLNKRMPEIKDKLKKKTPDGDFTFEDAIRIYIWNKNGYSIPGLSETDRARLVKLVMEDKNLTRYANTINIISKQKNYVDPTQNWETGDIRTDLDDATGRVGRKQFFKDFFDNVDIIFSQENLNKIEAAYGRSFRSALEDMLYRIETGRNRPAGQNQLVNRFMNYINGSVGSVMFFNMRSALLQQMSMVNFINFADNNIFAAAKAFANQKQYWEDWAFLFNSDFMKQRRGGIRTDINAAELAAELRKSGNKPRAVIARLLQLGFLPTQIGDNIAIASGGATYYRNRINTYLKQGLSKAEAQERAFNDFQAIAEATQQSARPDMVSQQQASPLGKIVLAFQNVTSQFNRIGKKAFLDIKNRRITPGNTTQLQSDVSNFSRIMYYFAMQNLIFYTLQTALFALMFDDDEDDEDLLKKKEYIIQGSLDSILRGSGIFGAGVATLKNMYRKFSEQRQKKYNPDESAVLMEFLNLSPPLGIKARKIVNAEKTLNYNMDVIKEMETFDIDNPVWSAVTNVIEGVTNIPVNRLYRKTQNVQEALNNENTALQRVLMFLGWSQYNLGIEDTTVQEVKEDIKIKKKEAKEKEKLEKEKEKLREKYPDKTDKEIQKAVLVEEKTKQVFDLNKREQVKIIKDLELNPKDYPKEKDRVDVIMEYYNKDPKKMDSTLNAIENYVPSKQEQRSIDLFKMNKKDQVNMLINLGLTTKQIKALKYEEDRVNEIIKLENKKKVKN